MSFDFLQSYKIPAYTKDQAKATSTMATTNLLEIEKQEESANALQSNENALEGIPPVNCVENIERFIPPGRHGTNYKPPPTTSLKRAKEMAHGSSPTKKSKQSEDIDTTPDGKLVMFYGRDLSYPDNLNLLIRPLQCLLCSAKMNSKKSAEDHYNSKAHDKSLTQWLVKNYFEQGLHVPDIKRYYMAGNIGPDAYHCEDCDMKLTSLLHAQQHYAGRKHRSVIANKTKPSGVGYYDANGKWVRIANKLSKSVTNDSRFGIGEQFLELQAKEAAAETSLDLQEETDNNKIAAESLQNDSAIETAVRSAYTVPASIASTVPSTDPKLVCNVCNTFVTSENQMEIHKRGARHQKKLTAASVDPLVDLSAISANNGDNLLAAVSTMDANKPDDYSMYRTPSGSYYCKLCNAQIGHIKALQQHLDGKKHLKRFAEATLKERNIAAKAALTPDPPPNNTPKTN